MKKWLLTLVVVFCVHPAMAKAETLAFDDASHLGVTLGGSTTWNGDGGGHLFMQDSSDDDYLYFSTPTYLNDFQMNGRPWAGQISYAIDNPINVAAFGSGGLLWSRTIDLRYRGAWGDWETISVEKDNVTSLKFYATFSNLGHSWPSIDNMRINEFSTVTPEPISSSLFLLGGGLMALRRYRRKKTEL